MSSDHEKRRLKLWKYAKTQLNNPNQGQALVNMIAYAIGRVRAIKPITGTGLGGSRNRWGDGRNVAVALIGDLESVLIGTDMQEGRGKGKFFAGNFKGAVGFKQNLRDQWNQVQHATAGLVIGYRHGIIGEWAARWLEDEPQDDRLYKVTCPIGSWLDDNPAEFEKLSEKMRLAICDQTCKPATSYLLWPPEVYGAKLDGRP